MERFIVQRVAALHTDGMLSGGAIAPVRLRGLSFERLDPSRVFQTPLTPLSEESVPARTLTRKQETSAGVRGEQTLGL